MLTNIYPQTWNGTGFTFVGGGNLNNQSLNLGPGAVTMTSTAQTITVNGSSTLYVGGTISDGANGLWDLTKAGPGTLELGENVTLSANQTLTASNIAAGTLWLGGAISNGSNTYGLTMNSSSGELTLSGVNTFKGGVMLTAGTLNITNASALGGGTLTINSGTGLDNYTINGNNGVTLLTNTPQTWNGNFAFVGNGNLNLGTGPVAMSQPPERSPSTPIR